MANFLVKKTKTTDNSFTLSVQADSEAEALQRAKDGDGDVIEHGEGDGFSYEIVRHEARTVPNPTGVH
jgi:hypothetical protein